MIEIGAYTADEDLLEEVRGGGPGRVRVSQPQALEIVLGRSSRPEAELRIDAVARDGVPVSRRRGGGCTVLLDPGNLVVAVVLPVPGLGAIDTWFRRISGWLGAELARLGYEGIERRGTSDLCLGQRKVGGSCIYRARGLLYYSTTLLVTPDFPAIERYLSHPPREPEYRASRAHGEFLTSLAEIDPGLTAESLLARLEPALTAGRLLAAVG